ncbi:protein of unknown function [Rhodovastum atsumiense]|nr:protein of unknown function [Rhodovastum atsumiense]
MPPRRLVRAGANEGDPEHHPTAWGAVSDKDAVAVDEACKCIRDAIDQGGIHRCAGLPDDPRVPLRFSACGIRKFP